jgi:uncharacterized membrane protein
MMKQNSILVIALLALIVMAVMPVQAQTITMSNPDATMERDIIVYSVNDTGLTNTTGIYGLYNTTSIIDIDPNLSYLFVLKPQYSNPLEEPGLWLSSMFNFVVANIAPILIIIFLIGLLLSRRRS